MIIKRDVINAGFCPRLAWYAKHHPIAPDASARERMKLGSRLGEMARELFPGGVLLPYGEESEAATHAALLSEAHTLFEASFAVDGMKTRVDVLRRDGDQWHLIEFKSSKEVKDFHLADVFFQAQVLRRAGLDIAEISIGLINGEYEYDGVQLEVAKLFRLESVTHHHSTWVAQIAAWTEVAEGIFKQDSAPPASWGRHCHRPERCVYFGECHSDIPEPTIFTIPSLHKSKEQKMIEFGIRGVSEIPDDSLLTDNQARYWRMVISGEQAVLPGLSDSLDRVRFPAVFLDFESFAPTIPVYAGTRPFQQLVFQWSAHTMEFEGEMPEQWLHEEFLAEGHEDPRIKFCATLVPVLRHAASVVHYSAFESTQLKKLAEQGILHAQECSDLFEAKKVDLEAIIKSKVSHPGFEGRTSIKKVLPVLVPNLSYEGLGIGNGAAAMVAFERIIDSGCDPETRATLRYDLLAYCKRDTEAMVYLYQALRSI